jgi:DNA-binding winged helix-turn-helix (wHTH) protein
MRLRFRDIVLDSDRRCVSRHGAPIHLEPKAFELLSLLAERRGAAASKRDIHDRLWPDACVSDSSLTTVARQLRVALGPGHVRTVRGFGYALDGDVAMEDEAAHAKATPPRFLVWNGRALPLAEGANVIGRDPDADVVVDAPGVSRRHAVIRVRGREAEIEDLESKNGTFVGGCRLRGRVALRDQDQLCLGRTPLAYRCPPAPGPTKTERLK